MRFDEGEVVVGGEDDAGEGRSLAMEDPYGSSREGERDGHCDLARSRSGRAEACEARSSSKVGGTGSGEVEKARRRTRGEREEGGIGSWE